MQVFLSVMALGIFRPICTHRGASELSAHLLWSFPQVLVKMALINIFADNHGFCHEN